MLMNRGEKLKLLVKLEKRGMCKRKHAHLYIRSHLHSATVSLL